LELRNEPTLFIEVLLRLVTAHPRLQQLEMTGVASNVQRHLVRAPKSFQVMAIHFPRSRPAFGTAQNDHRPTRAGGLAGTPRLFLDFADLLNTMLERGGHRLVHAAGFAAFYK